MPKPLTQKTRYQTLHSEVLLGKLTVPELVEKLPYFTRPEGSLPCLPGPANFPYPEPQQSNLHSVILFL